MRLFLILFALTAVGLKPMAGSAQELQLRGNDRWVVIAARQDQAAAVAVASSFRTLNPIVARATNSWFVVLAGPFNNPNLPALSRKFGLPDDAYLSRGQAYDRLVWKGSGSPAAGGDFEKARSWFTSLPAATRIEYQHLLTAAGHWPAVSNPEFGKRLFAAIQEFQESERFPPSGLLNSAELSRLRSKASPALLAWNLQPVTHPIGGVKLWVPQGFGLAREYEDGVISLTSNYASVLFSHFSGASVEHAYQAVRRLVIRDDVIDYEVMRDGFFVIASHNASLSSYTRFERHALGVVGFTLMWPPNSFGFGDRLSTIMSDLFRANVSLSENRTPPYWTPSYEAPRAETATVAAPAVPVAPSAAPKIAEKPKGGSGGSGFFVTPRRIVTNAHVVDGCEQVTVGLPGRKSAARVLARDVVNDLALLEADIDGQAIAKLRSGVRLGEDVAAFGFPLSGILATNGNFTRGTITATAGLGDDSRHLQVSAAVHPGNSGGPLLDESGNVVGTVVSKFNVLKFAALTNDMPQNINFAIKTSVVQSFLETHSTAFEAGVAGDPLRPADLAERAQSFAAALECEPR